MTASFVAPVFLLSVLVMIRQSLRMPWLLPFEIALPSGNATACGDQSYDYCRCITQGVSGVQTSTALALSTFVQALRSVSFCIIPVVVLYQ